MARWTVTITGKGVRKASVEKLAMKLREEFGEGCGIHVQDATPPEGRAARYAEATGKVYEAKSELEALRDELQEWYDNLPENFQNGEKGEQLQEAIDKLTEQCDALENVEGDEVSFPSMY